MRFMAVLIFSILFCGTSYAQIVTVVAPTANIRSSPSMKDSYVVIEAPRNYPLSVQSQRGDFFEVRDFLGRRGWIQKSLIDEKARGVVVEVSSMNVRQGPGTGYPVVFRAEQGVAFKVLGEKDGWLHVEHAGGKSGWVYKSLTWGQ